MAYLLGLDGAELIGTDGAYLVGPPTPDIYPVFASDSLNSQVTFNFGSTAYLGFPPLGYLNFSQDLSEAPTYGPFAATEAVDSAVFVANVTLTGYLQSAETSDTILFNGVVSNPPTEIFISYSTSDLNSQVTFNFDPATRPAGYLNWDLGPHSVVFVTLDVTEATDTALFNGALTAASGTLDFTEAPDTAAFFGSTGTALSGNLVTTEPSDGAVFSGEVTDSIGSLDVTEAPDVVAFEGNVIWKVILAATESQDSAIFLGELGYVSEAPDVAAFIGYAMDVPPVPSVPEVLKFGIPVSLSRW